MKAYDALYQAAEQAAAKEPRFVVQISWDEADTDYTYLTSSSAASVPLASPPVDTIHDAVLNISGQTQKINPDIATNTIGSITIELSDVTDNSASPILENQISTRINTKLDAGDGLRGRIVRVYVGYEDMAFTDYDLRVTYIVDSVSFMDGIYKLQLSDVQRIQKHKIFTPDETTLNSTITDTDLIIPVVSIDASLFPAVAHSAEWSVDPSITVGYIKIEKEVIRHTGGLTFDTTIGWHITATQRGALNTIAVEHTVDAGTVDNRKPKIKEHIYLEGASPKVIYALLTGTLLNGSSPEDTLPDHWNLGIDAAFVRLSDFQNLGVDMWDTTTGHGRSARIENPETQDGKRYIEKEILLWMGCFMPIYSTGEIGIRRLAGVLSDSDFIRQLNRYNIVSYSNLIHDMKSVINDIRVEWNWIDSKEEFTKYNLFIDADSISKHGTADQKAFKFKTVHTGIHTDEDLLTYFDVLRDRYSGPPLKLRVKCLPSLSNLEVGDIVNVDLAQVIDFTTNTTLYRPFEIQQVTTNWTTGELSLSLFGSSQRAGAIDRTTLSSVVLDSFYTAKGTDLATVLTIVAGHVTASGTLTGHATDIDNAAAVYYYDGDLTIDAGVTITTTENVQLRIKGVLQNNGTINGAGNGATGGAATTQFKNASTITAFSPSWMGTLRSTIDYDYGEQGYFGAPQPSSQIYTNMTLAVGVPPPVSSKFTLQLFDWKTDNTTLETLPFYQLAYDEQTNAITGYPSDIRGNAGSGGAPYIHNGTVAAAGNWYLLGSGGAGGDGGAGLLIVSRGMAFAGAGKIDLSGGASSIGTAYTQTTGDKFYGSAGAPGAPGVLLVLLDGQVTNPDIDDTVFIANYGDWPAPISAKELDHQDIVDQSRATGVLRTITIGNQPWGDIVGRDGIFSKPMFEIENVSLSGSAHRLQYIPPDETPAEEVIQLPPDVKGFIVTQNGDVVVFQWSPVANVFNAGFEVRYGPIGGTFESAIPLTSVTKGTNITSGAVPPGLWRFYSVAVNDAQDKYSATPATADLEVIQSLDIISQIAQSPRWPGTLSNFVRHYTGALVPTSQNLASADGWDTFDIFIINPYEICTYEAQEIDIGFDDNVRVWGDIESTLGPGETGIADPKYSIDYKLEGEAYDGFENWSIGNLELRYCKQKITLDTTVGLAVINEFLPTVDVLEHRVSDTGVIIAGSGGTTITFDRPFHSAPFVRVFMNGTTALIPTRSSVTETGFLCQCFNSSGVDVGGTVDWDATGS